jgi:hypothetical protein
MVQESLTGWLMEQFHNPIPFATSAQVILEQFQASTLVKNKALMRVIINYVWTTKDAA